MAFLPIEILVVIGRFLAGQNSYKTLANLGMCCKLLDQETASTLYETVLLDSNRGWWKDATGPSSRAIIASTSERQRERFKYTK
jgi:hypothetical protein